MNHRHYEDDGREVIEFCLNDDTTMEDILSLKQQAFLLCKKAEKAIRIGSDAFGVPVEIEWDDDRLEALLQVFDYFKKKDLLLRSLTMTAQSLENYGRFTRKILRYANALSLFKKLDLLYGEDLDEGENLFPGVTLNNCLETLVVFSDNHARMSDDDMSSLGHLLQTTSTLKWLELNRVWYFHNRALLRGLKSNQTLERICIYPHNCCVADSECAKFLETISRIPSLREFQLMYYKLGYLSSKALKKLLKDSMLHTLSLFACNCCDKSSKLLNTKYLVQGMKKTSSLRSLCIQGDVFCDPLPLSELLSAVPSCPSFTKLELRSLELTEEDFERVILMERLPHPIVLEFDNRLCTEHEEEIRKLRQSHPEIQVINTK